MTGTMATAVAVFADEALRSMGKCPNVAIGPVVWEIEPGHDSRYWYFVVGSVGAKRKLRITQLKIEANQDIAEQARASLLACLAQRAPIVVMDFNDELDMARWLEALCPGKRTRTIRVGLERERA